MPVRNRLSWAAVHALDDADGSVLWESEEIGAGGTPAVVGDRVVVGGEQLTVLEADTGTVRWSETFDETTADHEPAVTSPTVADGTGYVVAEESLFAFDLTNGSVRWSRETVELEETVDEVAAEPQSHVASFGSAPVAVANGLVYAVAGDAGCAAFDAADGETEWTHWRRDYGGLSFSGIAATAERVYVSGSPEDDFPVVDAATGDRVDAVPNVFAPAATAETRVAVSRDALRIHNYETGEGWEQVGGTTGWRDPSIVGDTIVVPYYPGYNERAVFGFDLADGSERWEFTHPVVDVDALAEWYAVTEDTLYTTGENGLVALRQETADEEADDEDEPDEEAGDEETEGQADEQESDETDGSDRVDDADGDETDTDANGNETNESESDGDEAGEDAEYEPGEDGGNGTDGTDEGDGSADDNTTDADESDDEANESDADVDADDEDADGTTGADDTDGGGDGNETDDASDGTAEGMPGFTTGAGIAGGALGLEWLRRRATVDDDLEG
ncbi:PQQ-binding-like beta-propeller repeat protein [Natronococcus sp.]|uniref:outer membrane protein assembly factor BamB family protein n=1 Tax=Natronococcus sp. TaxID=35747 RepID=UPI003A4E13E1